MGRRKIEIQPITHERNRSVTFLKRKNGLFKKAYELGVLCSVDVAVIIFEERAGHHLKLYQYCSGDIHDIVQRHVRYDGEKDTRTPHDFANNGNVKLDNVDEGDDDDADDDDPDSAPARGGAKKRDPKMKTEYGSNGKLLIPPANDLGMNVDQMSDYHLHRAPMTIPPPPMPLHHSSVGGGSSLPISSDRLLPTNGQLSKKPRLAPNINGHTSKHSDDPMYNGYLPSPTSAHSPAYRSQHNGHTTHQVPYGGSYLGSPPQSFLPPAFDFPSSSSRGQPISRTGHYGPRSSSYPQPQDPQLQGIYHQLMRNGIPPGQHPSNPDLLTAFLDNEDHRPPPSQSSQFAPLDWPTHGPSQQQQPQQQPSAPPPQQESGQPGDTSWLDFLGQSAPQQTGAQQLHMTLPPAGGRDSLSWERDRDAEQYSAERGGDASADKAGANGAILMSPRSRKRQRADSRAGGDERKSSPSSARAAVDSSSSNGHGHAEKEE
ncbi:hypothetical protein BV22DRAFT_1018042 [Leucogyrophana mollusca]|uniref:Uncharacterized protein n=1 Tax=Leucogyrophana mollusca TaxID=85980 RepID=A0ACB8B8K4_9AGAM|nr:hypothetical protein BV22DRAFT_1018042 [Leucogyrophana mollusca]